VFTVVLFSAIHYSRVQRIFLLKQWMDYRIAINCASYPDHLISRLSSVTMAISASRLMRDLIGSLARLLTRICATLKPLHGGNLNVIAIVNNIRW